MPGEMSQGLRLDEPDPTGQSLPSAELPSDVYRQEPEPADLAIYEPNTEARYKALVGRVHEFRENCMLPEDELEGLSPAEGQRLLEIIKQDRGREGAMLQDTVRASRLLRAALERAQEAGAFHGTVAQGGAPNEERKLLGRLQRRMLGVLDNAISPYEVFGIAPEQLSRGLLDDRYKELYKIRSMMNLKAKDSDENWVSFYLVDRAKAQLEADLATRQRVEDASAV